MADKVVTYKYKYKTELFFVNTAKNKTESISIDYENIKTFTIDHNFESNNMPTIYMTLGLDKALIDKIILNCNSSLFTFALYKIDVLNEDEIESECFRDKFTYFLPDDVNKNDKLDYDDNNIDETYGSTFKEITIGLMSIRNINDNKKAIETTIRNTTMYDAVKYLLLHMNNVLIEPFNYNDTFSQLIIPSKDSVSKELAYLNDYRVFYKTPYRFYMDFDCTYLLSSSGKGVERNRDKYNNVIIDIREIVDDDANDPGIMINKTTGNYNMVVSYLNTTVYDNTIVNKSKTEIRGITSNGSSKQSLSNIADYSTSKTSTVRLNNDNENMLENIVNDNEASNVFIYMIKDDVDTDVFTINKKYNINNIDRYKDHDGIYLLSRKREIYNREDENLFGMTMVLNFRKAVNNSTI